MTFAQTLTLTALCLATPISREQSKVNPILRPDSTDMQYIDPIEYTLKDDIDHIFAVPEKNSVGTECLEAVTLLDLSGKRVHYRDVRRSFKKYIRGDSFFPVFSKDTIAYTQNRSILLFNVKTGDFRSIIVPRILELTIRDAVVLDWERRLFLVNLDFIPGPSGQETDLWLVDLSGDQPKKLAEFDITSGRQAVQLGHTSFYFTMNGDRKLLHALDERLRPTHHPLLSVYNDGGGHRFIDFPAILPGRSGAIFASSDDPDAHNIDVWVASWANPDQKVSVYKLASAPWGGFEFSPDAKWVVFTDGSTGRNTLKVMPVDLSRPHLFAPPIELRSNDAVPEDWSPTCTWVSDPLSVVCIVDRSEKAWFTGEERMVKKLLKWELSPGNIKK